MLTTVASTAHGLLYGLAAGVYVFLCLMLLRSKGGGVTRMLLCVGCGATALWAAAAIAGPGPGSGPAGAALELARSAAWCAVMIHLLQRQFGGRRRMAGLAGCLAAIASFVMMIAVHDQRLPSPSAELLLGYLALAVFGAFLADNLYRGTPTDRRWHISLLFVGIGGMFVYDLPFYADAALFRQFSPLLADGRPIAAILAAPLVAVTAARNRDWVIDIHVSRDVVFHTGSLILSGIFLLALATVGEAFRVIGPGWGGLAEVALLLAGATAIGVSLTSGSARSRLRHLVVDNFFTHRYDYRKEWLRCIATLSQPDQSGPATRIIKALAAIADSPAGQLWMRDPEGTAFHWNGSWNLQPASGAEPADGPFAAAFRDGNWVIELEREPRQPEFVAEIGGAWLAVPLNHLGTLLGFVVLVAPRAPQRLDREAFDLLRIVGRQAASHAAERQQAQAMLETRRLRDFGNRFAFAVHDMKNVASQLSMIVQNAARFRSDPEFHDDVFLTVEAALGELNTLIARLRPAPSAVALGALSDPVDLIAEAIAAVGRTRGVTINLRHDGGRGAVAVDGELLRNVVSHLCDNAIDAAVREVSVNVRHERSRLVVDIADDGAGMPAEFVRDQLFAPFGSTKDDGLGIGAYQARELIRSVGGDLLAQSRPGVGTTMRIVLPCVAETIPAAMLSPA